MATSFPSSVDHLAQVYDFRQRSWHVEYKDTATPFAGTCAAPSANSFVAYSYGQARNGEGQLHVEVGGEGGHVFWG